MMKIMTKLEVRRRRPRMYTRREAIQYHISFLLLVAWELYC